VRAEDLEPAGAEAGVDGSDAEADVVVAAADGEAGGAARISSVSVRAGRSAYHIVLGARSFGALQCSCGGVPRR
jgi:hypothetical protein